MYYISQTYYIIFSLFLVFTFRSLNIFKIAVIKFLPEL